LPKLKLAGRVGAVVLLIVGLSGGAYAVYCAIIISTGNFHSVEAGQLYRSAQLDAAEFEQVIPAYHIRSVLNLRGPNPESAWYADELAVAERWHVAHFDVGISARRSPTPEQLDRILAILRTAPKPLLIHCQAGADRTGLVAALYRYAIGHEPAERSADELSLRYGHFPYLTSETGAMDESFRTYVLTAPHAADSP